MYVEWNEFRQNERETMTVQDDVEGVRGGCCGESEREESATSGRQYRWATREQYKNCECTLFFISFYSCWIVYCCCYCSCSAECGWLYVYWTVARRWSSDCVVGADGWMCPTARARCGLSPATIYDLVAISDFRWQLWRFRVLSSSQSVIFYC